MASTEHDLEFPYRESEGTKPLRPGGAEPDDTPDFDPGFNWLFVGLGVVLAIGIVIGLWQIGSSPAGPEQLNYRELAPFINPTR
jgi:hypothetical protein